MLIAKKYINTILFLCTISIYTNVYPQSGSKNSEANKQTDSKAAEEQFDFVVRLGQGGFRDSRSPENALGGGQLTLDIKPKAAPIALSLSSEYYTNSPNPTHSYEIENLYSVNILYYSNLEEIERLSYFFGGGVGWLKVPEGESNPEKVNSGNLVNLEAGVNYLAFWKIGVYGIVKYLRAQKSENSKKVINFDEKIVLLGFTFNFSL